MTKPLGSRDVAQLMLSWLGLELVSHEELQTLWAGYGQICALKARLMDASVPVPVSWQSFSREDTVHLILKLVSSPAEGHVGRDEDEGHVRKMLSYGVEQCFYDEVAPRLGHDIPVARCLVSTRGMRENAVAAGIEGLTATIMSDLRLEFPVAGEKREVLSQNQVHAAIDWLAGFHAASWGLMSSSSSWDANDFVLPPLEEQAKRRQQDAKNGEGGGRGGGEGRSSLWLNGGYTYLATRRTEYDSLACNGQSEWNAALCAPTRGSGSDSIAEMVARFLTPSGRPFEAYLHGDVKSENLFSTVTRDRVALYDFQYVGLGLGVSDLTKLFTCSVPVRILTGYGNRSIPDRLSMDDGERRLLERYRAALMERRQRDEEKRTFEYQWDVFVRHWETALVDWCRFQASWGFWGNTDWLEARVRSILSDDGWRKWLERELS